MTTRALHARRTRLMVAVTFMAVVGIGSVVAVAAQPSTPSSEALPAH